MATPVNLGEVRSKEKLTGYKAFRFNVRAEDKHGNLLLYNTYTNKFVSIPESGKNAVTEMLRKPDETIVSEGKLALTLMPNEDCNFRCKYCYESFAKNYMSESVRMVSSIMSKRISTSTPSSA